MALAPNIEDRQAIGYFIERDAGNIFEYDMERDYQEFFLAGKMREFPHRVWVTEPWKHDCGYRRALVKKTVVYIVVDEDENGAIIEKWYLRNNQQYAFANMYIAPGQALLERLARDL